MTHLSHVKTADGSTMRIEGLVLSGTPRPVPMTVLIQTFISEGVLVVVPAESAEQKQTTMVPRSRGRKAELGG